MYNAFGQRVIKSASGNTTIFLYDPTGNLIAEADETGEIVNEYIWLNGRLLAGVKKEMEDINTIDASVRLTRKL